MITVILDNVRSTYNVGAVMRTLDGVGGGELVCTGITPHPDLGETDDRSPVVKTANSKQIAKTALGAEHALTVRYASTVDEAIAALPPDNFIVAIEQHPDSKSLFDAEIISAGSLVVILGGEIEGIGDAALARADAIYEIPMRGSKESLNVSVTAGIALYHLDRLRH